MDDAKILHREYFDPKSNGFGWIVHYEFSDYWCDVKAYEIVMLDSERRGAQKYFQRKDAVTSPDPVETTEEAEVYLEGYVKSDGCNELDAGRPHMCSLEDIKAHCSLIEHVYSKAIELMGGEI